MAREEQSAKAKKSLYGETIRDSRRDRADRKLTAIE